MSHDDLSSSVKMTQRLPAALTSLDVALRLLLDGVGPVDPIGASLEDSVGGIAATIGPQQGAHPMFDIAVTDGWALRARELVGTSSYSPLSLPVSPAWVEAGDRLPDHCDCVLDTDLVEQVGPVFQVLAEAAPGHGIRRAGDDIGAGRSIVISGQRVNEYDVLAVGAAGLDRIEVRSPRVCVIDIPSADGNTASSNFVAGFATSAGARVTLSRAKGRDAESVSRAIDLADCDLLVLVGGTGLGRTDATVQALAVRGTVLAHGLALQPGRTAAAGKIGTTPVIAVPGTPDQALAGCLTLIQPLLDMLAVRCPRRQIIRPLARKISSAIGVTEIVLLERSDDAWMPLAVGQLSLEAITRADAWLAVPGDSEGYATGAAVGAFPLREVM